MELLDIIFLVVVGIGLLYYFLHIFDKKQQSNYRDIAKGHDLRFDIEPIYEGRSRSLFVHGPSRTALAISTGGNTIEIPFSDITKIEIMQEKKKSTVTKTKRKGTITRAVVGGALTGGVGAVVGAISAPTESKTHTTTQIVSTDVMLRFEHPRFQSFKMPIPNLSKAKILRRNLTTAIK